MWMSGMTYCVRVLSLRSGVIHGFVTEPWHSRHVLFSCKCAASSVLEPCALSSVCLVSCWSMGFGSRHSCLEFRFHVGVRTLALHVLSHCVSVCGLEFARPRALLSTCVLWCCMQFMFLSAACIRVISLYVLPNCKSLWIKVSAKWKCKCKYLVLCGTQLVYSLAACFHVVMSCVNTWLMSSH